MDRQGSSGGIIAKRKIRKKAVKAPVHNGWLKDSKDIANFRKELSEEQDGLDPILCEPLRKPCLDHDHLTGRCRGVLSQCTNTFEGYVLKYWMKYCNEYTDCSLSEALRRMADYLEKDYSDFPLHKNYRDDMTKFLRRCSKATIIARAESDLNLVIDPECTKHEAIEFYMQEFIKKTEERDFYGDEKGIQSLRLSPDQDEIP
ncbi:hypothetical protein [Escherichia phage phiWec189]|uniref:Packaging and recombination endonuclease n=2 Tax=Vequintavirus TaxID=1914852 RepID=A0AAE8AWJ7_9CAUD|nr:endonuclease domain-containing protein [Escherichia coli]EFC1962027.1 hypothetical protein [Escherichia coli]EFW7027123.1 hypothetical protein [Shigella sonnei]QXV75746.1 packaging and recombination endonuclease [Escherichia phage AlexBoehm]BDU13526.1 hypothetical protein [Escherichia phage phiWec189]